MTQEQRSLLGVPDPTRPSPRLSVAADAQRLATVVAERTLGVLASAQQAHGRAAIAFTAGSIMEQVWSVIADSAQARRSDQVDWSLVDVFWGDERFVPADSADRNDGPANRLLFDRAPFSEARQFPMPTSNGRYGDDLDAAAAGYAADLAGARRADDEGELPNFDVVLLGLGPDGHCASLFPGHPGLFDDSGPVIAVRQSPKPPPNRISLSFRGLAQARAVWFVASGAGKADAVALAWSGAGPVVVPSAGPRGQLETLWLIDEAAAAELPSAVRATAQQL